MTGWRRLSIGLKLPLGLAALLFAVMAAMTVLVYLEVRRISFESTASRLDGVSHLLADALASSAHQRFAALREAADHPRVRAAALRGIAGPDTAAVRAALRTNAGGSAQLLAVELWDSAGRRVVTSHDGVAPMAAAPARALMDAIRPESFEVVGEYEATEAGVEYAVAAAVFEESRLAGYVVERRLVAGSPANVRQISGLIGMEARLLIGNADGGVWTDFTRRVDGPPPGLSGREEVVRYEGDDGMPVLGRILPVSATPWTLAIEFPEGPVFANARRVLTRAGWASLVLVLIGAGTGLVMSRRLSVPLDRLTAAAESVAAGGAHVRVSSDREDEVGRLAATFNTMVDRLDESRRTLENRVAERTAALAAANHELEAFSYSVSHDLRAPLRAVDGFAAVLEEDHIADLSGEAQRYLRHIRQNAQQMGQLIDDLLALSRLGRATMHSTHVDMTELARDVVNHIQGAHGNAQSPAIVLDPLPPAYGERSMLRQVFANYIQNAVKFSRNAPDPRVHIGSRVEDGDTVYFVSDNGVGFDMRYVDKLFGVFQRLHASDEFEGTGVGLAIVQRIVHRHGGRVWGEGRVGEGATFYFMLPVSGHHNGPART